MNYFESSINAINTTYKTSMILYDDHTVFLFDLIKNHSKNHVDLENLALKLSPSDLYRIDTRQPFLMNLLEYSKIYSNRHVYELLNTLSNPELLIKEYEKQLYYGILKEDRRLITYINSKVEFRNLKHNPIEFSIITNKSPKFMKFFNRFYHASYKYYALYASDKGTKLYAKRLHFVLFDLRQKTHISDRFIKEYFDMKMKHFKDLNDEIFEHIELKFVDQNKNIKQYLAYCQSPIKIAEKYFSKEPPAPHPFSSYELEIYANKYSYALVILLLTCINLILGGGWISWLSFLITTGIFFRGFHISTNKTSRLIKDIQCFNRYIIFGFTVYFLIGISTMFWAWILF